MAQRHDEAHAICRMVLDKAREVDLLAAAEGVEMARDALAVSLVRERGVRPQDVEGLRRVWAHRNEACAVSESVGTVTLPHADA